MSNALLPRIAKVTGVRSSLSKYPHVSTRRQSGKKFLIPDSFQPHLRANNNRRNNKKFEYSGARAVALGQYPKNDVVTPEEGRVTQALDNRIEYRVANESQDAFALSNESVIHDFCGQAHHPHVASSMKAHLSVNYSNDTAVQLFWDAVADYLPQNPLTRGSLKTPRGKSFHQSYSWASLRGSQDEADASKYSKNIMNLGWHLFTFSTPIQRHGLLYDGTDMRFLPGPASIWRYRLWAGGSINLYKTFGKELPTRAQHQLERPIDLRIVGTNQTPEKLFVTVSKQFTEIRGPLQQPHYSASGVLRELRDGPVYNNNGTLAGGAYLEEKYTLCFLRNPPNLSEKGTATRVITPPVQPKFSHTLTPDRHLLFCWSALSYNAHLIHLDKQFAQEEYGAKDLVVHGPLTLMLVLEWFQREITRYALERQLSRFHLHSIDYKCLAPLFVDEPMTLCTKPSKFPTPGTLAESWEVWVQKDLGDGVQSVAFKGTIKLRTEYEPRLKHEHKSRTVPADNADVDPGSDEFKSPFF